MPAKLRVVFYKPVEEEEDNEDQPATSGSSKSEYKGVEPQAEVRTEAIANADYVIDIDGLLKQHEGKSNGEGLVEIPIMPDVREAVIRFYPGTDDEVSFPLNLGQIDPVDEISGVRQRLHNLGYQCEAEGEEMDPGLRSAVQRFQHDNELESNGEINQATKDKLVEVHGC